LFLGQWNPGEIRFPGRNRERELAGFRTPVVVETLPVEVDAFAFRGVAVEFEHERIVAAFRGEFHRVTAPGETPSAVFTHETPGQLGVAARNLVDHTPAVEPDRLFEPTRLDRREQKPLLLLRRAVEFIPGFDHESRIRRRVLRRKDDRNLELLLLAGSHAPRIGEPPRLSRRRSDAEPQLSDGPVERIAKPEADDVPAVLPAFQRRRPVPPESGGQLRNRRAVLLQRNVVDRKIPFSDQRETKLHRLRALGNGERIPGAEPFVAESRKVLVDRQRRIAHRGV